MILGIVSWIFLWLVNVSGAVGTFESGYQIQSLNQCPTTRLLFPQALEKSPTFEITRKNIWRHVLIMEPLFLVSSFCAVGSTFSYLYIEMDGFYCVALTVLQVHISTVSSVWFLMYYEQIIHFQDSCWASQSSAV